MKIKGYLFIPIWLAHPVLIFSLINKDNENYFVELKAVEKNDTCNKQQSKLTRVDAQCMTASLHV